MSTQADAASGPATGDAGKAAMSLSDAITAAFGPEDRGGVDAGQEVETPPADIDDELTNPEAAKHAQSNKGKTQNAGDDRGAEDATDDTPEVADPKAKAAADKASNAKAPEAPKHWDAETRAAFSKLPAEGQATMLKLARNLEGGFTRKSQDLSDKVKFADSVSGLFDAETRAQLKRAGTDESGAIKFLLDTQRFATKEPAKYVAWTMQQLGVTPEMLGLGAQTQSAQAKAEGAAKQEQGEQNPSDRSVEDLLADPAVKQLRTELSEAKQLLSQQQDMIQRITGNLSAREQAEQTWAQSQRQQHRDQLASTIQGFRTELDESGQLAFPHFDRVARQMGALMDTHPALSKLPDGPEKMKLAYEHAVWADPELRVAFVEAEASKKAQAAEKAAAAQRAKRAAAVKPAQGAPSTKVKIGSMDDAINAAFNKLGH
jgi:hypothetical protein